MTDTLLLIWESMVLSSSGTPGHWHSKTHHCLDSSETSPLKRSWVPLPQGLGFASKPRCPLHPTWWAIGVASGGAVEGSSAVYQEMVPCRPHFPAKQPVVTWFDKLFWGWGQINQSAHANCNHRNITTKLPLSWARAPLGPHIMKPNSPLRVAVWFFTGLVLEFFHNRRASYD